MTSLFVEYANTLAALRATDTSAEHHVQLARLAEIERDHPEVKREFWSRPREKAAEHAAEIRGEARTAYARRYAWEDQ